MPCSSSHMEPNAAEEERQNVAELLVKMHRVIGRRPTKELSAQAAHVYGEGPKDVDELTAELCAMCEDYQDDLREACGKLIRDALDVGAWYKLHLEWDEEREEAELRDAENFELEATIQVSLNVMDTDDGRRYGVSHTSFEFGGVPVDGIAMYARVDGEEDRWVTLDNWQHAWNWFQNHGATAKDLRKLRKAYDASKADE